MSWDSLIITTAQNIIVTNGKTLSKTISGQGLYYGITYLDDLIIVLARRTQGHRAPKGNLLQIHNRDLQLKEEIQTSVQDGHQILASNDKIIITNSAYNCLTIWDGTSFVETAWRQAGDDYNHINSIWFDWEREQYYVIEHNLGTAKRDLKQTSTLVLLDKDFFMLREIKGIGRAAHNIVRIHERTISLSSFTKSIIVQDEQTKKRIKFQESIFLRGMAVIPPYIYLGGSAFGSRNNRINGNSFIYQCDFNTFKIIDSLVLQGTGQLLDIRGLETEKDLAHLGKA